MSKILRYTISQDGSAFVFFDGEQFSILPDCNEYDEIIAALRSRNKDELSILLPHIRNDTAESLISSFAEFADGQVVLRNGEVYMGEERIFGNIAKQISEIWGAGHSVDPLIQFLLRVAKNPIVGVREELYDFCSSNHFVIDEQGLIVAYKKVRSDYFDIHSRTVKYPIGAEVSIDPEECDTDRTQTCSSGLHFCAFSYLDQFGSRGSFNDDRILIVKIDPADVVSIPVDYNFAKGRTWRMYVEGEIENGIDILKNTKVITKEHEQKIVEITKDHCDVEASSGVVFYYPEDQLKKLFDTHFGSTLKIKYSDEDLTSLTLPQITAAYNSLVTWVTSDLKKAIEDNPAANTRFKDFPKNLQTIRSQFKCSKTEAKEAYERLVAAIAAAFGGISEKKYEIISLYRDAYEDPRLEKRPLFCLLSVDDIEEYLNDFSSRSYLAGGSKIERSPETVKRFIELSQKLHELAFGEFAFVVCFPRNDPKSTLESLTKIFNALVEIEELISGVQSTEKRNGRFKCSKGEVVQRITRKFLSMLR